MKSFLNPESPPMRFLTTIGYAICLNCLWLICSLPIVTAGASTTALYDVMQKVVLNEESRIISSFFSKSSISISNFLISISSTFREL